MQDTKNAKKIIKSLKDIEKMVVLMKKHKISQIETDGVLIKIDQFDPSPLKPETKPMPQEGDDELLFWSSETGAQ